MAMHSSRCVRFLNMKVLALCGLLSVIVTTFLTLRYAAVPQSGINQDVPLQRSGHIKSMHVKKPIVQITKCRDAPVLDPRPLLSVPRIAKYCNIPNSEPMGEEGLVPEDLKLLAAHAVIRHGDRAPLMHLPGEKAPPLSCLVDARQFSHVPKVENYEQVMGLAAESEQEIRSDFSRWAMYPSRTECMEGQLTGQGAIQQVLSGLHLHQRYSEPPHNLRLDYSTVAVHSTVVSRTYQSALAFLYGLLPEFDRKELKVQASTNIMFCDANAVPGSVCSCPGLDTLRNQAISSCRGKGSMDESMATYETSAAKTLAQVLGVPETRLPSPEGVMDALSRYACHSIPPPCVTTTTNSSGTRCTTTSCVDAKTMEAVWAPVDAQSRCMGKNTDYLKFASASTQGLLLRIAQGLHRIAQGDTSSGDNPLFVLYSGHDNTLSPLIIALGLKDQVWPGYATRLVFELYRRSSTPDVKAQHFIRILLNGKPVTQEALFCRAGSVLSGGDDLCEFERFHRHVVDKKVLEFCSSLRSGKSVRRRRKRAPTSLNKQ